MRDCGNGEVRDLLPELLDGDPARPALAGARAHVDQCPACRDELALLRAVRSATRGPAVDAAAIAGAIAPYRPTSRWTRLTASPAVRVAAAILVVVGVGSLVRGGPDGATPDTAVAAASVAAPGELAVGTPLGELSDADLQSLLRELGDLEAVTPAEADVVVIPSVERSGV